MLSSRAIRNFRAAQAAKAVLQRQSARPLLFPLSQCRHYADKIVQVPQMAESISEGTLRWYKQIGDHVTQDEEIATIETDKIDVAVNAPNAGIVKEFFVNEEDTVIVGQDIVRLELSDSVPEVSAPGQDEAEAPNKEPEPPKTQEPKPHAPEPELESKSESQKPAPPKAAPPQPSPPKQPSTSVLDLPKSTAGNRDEHRVKMNRMRLRIAERLKESQNTAASLTTFNEVDMSAVMEFRKAYKDQVLQETGVKLGFMSIFTLACVKAMRQFPIVNASIEGPNGGDTIVYRDYVDVSVAVATEKGLVTPVVRNVQSMDMVSIEQAIAEVGKKARDGKLTIEDMAGGTFTISNGGVFGSLMGTPIINLPQAAVLGLHAIKERVVVVNGKPEVRPMMYLALTYDHRLLDGREAVQFLIKVKQYVEDPRRMLL